MSTAKDSFMASDSLDTPIDNMWNDLMTELESDLDKVVPKKIARTKDRVSWETNKLKKQVRKQEKWFKKKKGSNKFSRASQHYIDYNGFVHRQP